MGLGSSESPWLGLQAYTPGDHTSISELHLGRLAPSTVQRADTSGEDEVTTGLDRHTVMGMGCRVRTLELRSASV